MRHFPLFVLSIVLCTGCPQGKSEPPKTAESKTAESKTAASKTADGKTGAAEAEAGAAAAEKTGAAEDSQAEEVASSDRSQPEGLAQAYRAAAAQKDREAFAELFHWEGLEKSSGHMARNEWVFGFEIEVEIKEGKVDRYSSTNLPEWTHTMIVRKGGMTTYYPIGPVEGTYYVAADMKK